MFRQAGQSLQVFLVHPEGPYWSRRNKGAWTIPKGEYEEGEDLLHAARREFTEETGFHPSGLFLELGSVRQKGGKTVVAWAFAGDCDPSLLVSNTCEIEWPPRSKRRIVISEVDGGEWFTLGDAPISSRRTAALPEPLT
jgi:predicted NUDIX family NTP pyrophosphohydrolase